MSHRTRIASCMVAAAALLGPAISATSSHADVSQCAPITIDAQEVACVAVASTPFLDSDGEPGVQVSVTLNVLGQQPITQSQTIVVPVSTTDRHCVSEGRAAIPWDSDPETVDPGFVYGYGNTEDFLPGWCFGWFGLAITNVVPATATVPGLSTTPTQIVDEPYHVPQICITSMPGACLGPYDGTIAETVPVPTLNPAPGVDLGTASQVCILTDRSVDPSQLPLDAVQILPAAFQVPVKPGSDGSYPFGYYDNSLCAPYIPVGLPHPQGS